MRAIKKSNPPKELSQFKAGGGKSYDEFNGRSELRDSIVKEQRGLCAFCGGRIEAHPLKMKIAHWWPQKAPGGAEHQLDYTNMLGACRGGEGFPPPEQHCDTHQGNKMISRNPAVPAADIDNVIRYDPRGAIFSADRLLNSEIGPWNEADAAFDRGVLNLNFILLRKNRRAALDVFLERIARTMGKRTLTAAQVEKELSAYDGRSAGILTPYAPIVAHYLRRRRANLKGVK
jgi:uncharacterized protein (TIGR02646 family)